MSHIRRLPLLAAVAILVALGVGGCAGLKTGSLKLSQPGLGAVRVHVVLCTLGEEAKEPKECTPSGGGEETTQTMIAIAVPPGSSAPTSITAVGVNGAPTFVLPRSTRVTNAFATEVTNPEPPDIWPPPGREIIGYLGTPVTEKGTDNFEWTIDVEIGLPAGAGGGSFAGPFAITLAGGSRAVTAEEPAGRPVDCLGEDGGDAFCSSGEGASLPISDLKISAPPAATAFPGATVKLPFGFDLGTTVSPPPSFALAATSTLKKAKLRVSTTRFVPGPISPTTGRAPAASRKVSVEVPSGAKPGSYAVSLVATAAAGGTATQVATLRVIAARIGLGRSTLNRGVGTARVAVKLPGAGTLTVSGQGVVKKTVSVKKAKAVKVTIAAKGAKKAALLADGSTRVKAKFSFKPSSGDAVTKSRSVTLSKR